MSGRRVLRALILGGLVLVLLALLSHTVLVRWAEYRWADAAAHFERESGSLDLKSWELLPPAEEPNSATWIAKGTAAIVMGSTRNIVRALPGKPRADWSPEEIAHARATIDLNHHALEILGRARNGEPANFSIRIRDGGHARLPNLLDIVDAVRLLHVRGALALEDGRRDDVLADVELLATIAHHLQRERVMIAVLVGSAVERMQLSLVRAFVEDPTTSRAELARLEASVEHNDLLFNYAQSWVAEGAAVCSALRNGEDTVGLGAVPLHFSRRWQIAPLLAISRPIDAALAAKCLELYAEIARDAGLPYVDARDALERTSGQLSSFWLVGDVDDDFSSNLVSGSGRISATVALRRLSTLALTMRHRALDTGSYPENLDLSGWQESPDPLTGASPIWQVVADGSAVLELPGAAQAAAELWPPTWRAVSWRIELPPPLR